MKKIQQFESIAIVFIFLLCLVTSCKQPANITNITNVTNITYKDAEEESLNFVTEGVPFYCGEDKITDVFSVRFYDEDHFIPYISVRYFFEKIMSFKLESFSYADGKYKYQRRVYDNFFSMIVDVNNDTITCPDDFYLASDNSTDLPKYTPYNQTDIFTGQKTQTFDLHAYGFKIYGGVDDAYVPFFVMNQLFISRYYYNYVYNGEGFYCFLMNYYSPDLYEDFLNSSWYKNKDGSVAERPAELIELSYNMLCFTHDYLYGQPGYYGFADDGNGSAAPAIVAAADKLKLDELLQTYDPKSKTLLLSSSYYDYLKGITRLTMFDYGDVHAYIEKELYKDFYISDIDYNYFYWKNLSKKVYNYYDIANDMKTRRLTAGKAIESEDGNTLVPIELEVISGGKTAVIRFDSFWTDNSGWNAYYNQKNLTANPNPDPTKEELNEGKVAVPNDTSGLFYRSFYTIMNNPDYADVKNIIIDLSCNPGGDTDACYKNLAYLIESVQAYTYDVHTNTFCKIITTSDLNLDGIIDDSDKDFQKYLSENYNFAILTNYITGSAANIFACYCTETGIPVIGKRSLGASCVYLPASTVDCIFYRYSYKIRISYEDGSTTEDGAPVTKELTYDQFYDDAALQAVMDELFVNK